MNQGPGLFLSISTDQTDREMQISGAWGLVCEL